MSSSSHGYVFLELAAIVYLLGFGGPYLRLPPFRRMTLLGVAGGVIIMWFSLDQIALGLGIWTFPQAGTLRFRLFRLPSEEYLGFFLHTIACYALAMRCNDR